MKTMVFNVKNIGRIALCLFLLVMVACKKDKNDPEESGSSSQTTSVIGNVSKPAWTVSEDYDMTSSMTMVIKVNLSSVYTAAQLEKAKFEVTSEDLIAAFAGDTCLGVDTLNDGLFHLYIGGTTAGVESFQLKYYSSVLKHIYAGSQTIPYVINEHMGTPNDPEIPEWKVEK